MKPTTYTETYKELRRPHGKFACKLFEATILSDAIDTASFKVLREQNNFLNPIGVEDVTQYIDESRQEPRRPPSAGEVLNEAQENAASSIEARRPRRLHD